MMIISTWDRVHFLIYLLNHNPPKIGQMIDERKGNIFRKSYEQFGWLWLSSRPVLNYQPAPMTIYVKFLVLHFYERASKVQLQEVHVNY